MVEGKMQIYTIGSAKKVLNPMLLLQGKIFERIRLKRASMPGIWD